MISSIIIKATIPISLHLGPQLSLHHLPIIFQPTFLKELSVLTVCECLPLTYSSLINPYQYSISQRLPLKIILLRLSMTLMAVHTMNVFQFSYLKSKSLKYVDHLIILKYSLFSPTPCFLPICFLLIIAFLIYIPIVYYLIIKI